MLGRFVPVPGPSGEIHLNLQGTNLYVTEADLVPVQEQLVKLMMGNNRVLTETEV